MSDLFRCMKSNECKFLKFNFLVVRNFEIKQKNSNDMTHLSNTDHFFLYKYFPKCDFRKRCQTPPEIKL